ncbi:MAG: hypothetical protein ACRC7S_13990, partial [Cetobacterium sp.]
MSLQISNVYLNLDTNKPSQKIDERFLQGNLDKVFKFKLFKNNEQVTISDGIKPIVVLVFYNGSGVFKKYKISPTLEDGGTNTNYKLPVTVDNEVTIPFTADLAFADHAGRTDLILYLEDGNNYYTYSCTYNVDLNEAYKSAGIIDNLPSIDNIKNDINTVKGRVSTLET